LNPNASHHLAFFSFLIKKQDVIFIRSHGILCGVTRLKLFCKTDAVVILLKRKQKRKKKKKERKKKKKKKKNENKRKNRNRKKKTNSGFSMERNQWEATGASIGGNCAIKFLGRSKKKMF